MDSTSGIQVRDTLSTYPTILESQKVSDVGISRVIEPSKGASMLNEIVHHIELFTCLDIVGSEGSGTMDGTGLELHRNKSHDITLGLVAS